jgi:zinc protease
MLKNPSLCPAVSTDFPDRTGRGQISNLSPVPGAPALWPARRVIRVVAPALLLFLTQTVWATPAILNWQTGSESRVYFVESRELPMVDVRLIFDAGAAREPAGRNGLAALVNSLLDEGASGLDATGISFEFERLGARYSAASGYDFASVSLRSLSDPALLGPALQNLRRVITEPAFPMKAVERQKQRLLIAIERKQQSPAEIARDAYQAAIYRDHPYAYPSGGTRGSVAELGRGDIVNFHRDYYSARNLRLVIVGDLDREQAAALAEDLTGGLAQGQAPEPLPAVERLAQGETIRIEHPSSQVHVLFGQPGLKRGDPDYFPLYVGNHILGGGGFVSRLHEEIREKRGLSYGAYSYFAPRREAGPFTASLQTRGGQEEQALQVMRETIRSFTEQGPTAEELEAAKKNISGGFPLRLDSNSKILGYIAMIAFYGLPLDYLDTFIEKVNAVKLEQVREAFRRRLQPERFVTVMVGPVSGD